MGLGAGDPKCSAAHAPTFCLRWVPLGSPQKLPGSLGNCGRILHTSLWEKLCHAGCSAGWLCPDLGEVCPGHVSRRLVLTCKGGKAQRVGTVLETTGWVPPHQGECSRRNFLGHLGVAKPFGKGANFHPYVTVHPT